jgi:hypothetical protein
MRPVPPLGMSMHSFLRGKEIEPYARGVRQPLHLDVEAGQQVAEMADAVVGSEGATVPTAGSRGESAGHRLECGGLRCAIP